MHVWKKVNIGMLIYKGIVINPSLLLVDNAIILSASDRKRCLCKSQKCLKSRGTHRAHLCNCVFVKIKSN